MMIFKRYQIFKFISIIIFWIYSRMTNEWLYGTSTDGTYPAFETQVEDKGQNISLFGIIMDKVSWQFKSMWSQKGWALKTKIEWN